VFIVTMNKSIFWQRIDPNTILVSFLSNEKGDKLTCKERKNKNSLV